MSSPEDPAWVARLAARPTLVAALLLLVTTLTWAGAVHSGHIGYDTPWLVLENHVLQAPGASGLVAAWTDLSLPTRLVLGAEYLPVRDTTVWLDFRLFGLQLAGHHLHSLLWYLLACALFLALATELLGPGPRAWLAGLLFALHPVHVESVAWLAGRKDVVSLALLFAAMLLWRRARGRWGLLLLSALLGLLAHWAKNTAVVLPALLVSWSLLVDRPDLRRPAWWARWLPYGLAAAIGLGLSLSLGQEVVMYAQPRTDGPVELVSLIAQVWAHYVGTLVLPTGLSLAYAEPRVLPLSAPPVLASLALLGGMAAAAALLWRRAPVVTLGAAWFALGLLPVSQLVPIQNLVADRYLLVPSAGLVLALCALPLPRPARAPAAGLALAASAGLALLTTRYLPVFHDSVAVWSHVTRVQPEAVSGWTSLAGALEGAGRPDDARASIDQATALLGERPMLLAIRGWFALEDGALGPAEADLRAAWLGSDRVLRKAGNNLVAVLARQGRAEEALAVAEELVAVHPRYAQGWATLAGQRVEQRDAAGARAAAERALALEPRNVGALVNLGSAALLAGERDLARSAWQRALALDPDNAYVQAGLRAVGG